MMTAFLSLDTTELDKKAFVRLDERSGKEIDKPC
jgi:hypothetical protein